MSAPLLLAIDHNGDVPILTGSVKKHRQYIDARSENNIYCVNFYRLYHKYRSYRLLAIGDLSITAYTFISDADKINSTDEAI